MTNPGHANIFYKNSNINHDIIQPLHSCPIKHIQTRKNYKITNICLARGFYLHTSHMKWLVIEKLCNLQFINEWFCLNRYCNKLPFDRTDVNTYYFRY